MWWKRAFLALALIMGSYEVALAQDAGSCIFRLSRSSLVDVRVSYQDASGQQISGTGTGFIVSPAGHVVTNSHVLPEQGTFQNLSIMGAVGSRHAQALPMSIVDRSTVGDLALLMLPNMGAAWAPVVIGQASMVTPGSPVFAMGFPLDADVSIVDGRISSLNATIPSDPRAWWQTSVPLNPGNSGGPVFNAQGVVVAIAVARRRDAQAFNFVIPVDHANTLLALAPVTRGEQAFNNASDCRRMRERITAHEQVFGPFNLRPGEARNIPVRLSQEGAVDVTIERVEPQWAREEDRGREPPGLAVRICSAEMSVDSPCPHSQVGQEGVVRRRLPAGPGTITVFNFTTNPQLAFTARVEMPNSAAEQ